MDEELIAYKNKVVDTIIVCSYAISILFILFKSIE